MEDPQAVLAARLQQVAQVGLVVAACAWPGAVVVEPPDGAVGKHAPANAAVRSSVCGLQIAQDLAVRCVAGRPVAGISHVQRQTKALAFLHGQGVAEACVWILLSDGTRLGVGVGEQQVVGDVLVARGTLLRQVVSPAQRLQQRTHQLLFRSRLMQVGRVAELSESLTRRLVEGGERFRFCDGALPFWRGLDAVRQEILGEQLTGHVGSSKRIHVAEGRHLAPNAATP